MKPDPTPLRNWTKTGLTWIPLSAGLLLALGCAAEAPKPPASLDTATATAVSNTSPTRQVKAVGKNMVVDPDDLRARRSKRSLASNRG
jgi:hypothetical protein